MRFLTRLLLLLLALVGPLSAEPRLTFHNSVAPFPDAVDRTKREVSAQEAKLTQEFSVALRLRNYPEMQAKIARGELIPRPLLEQNHLPLQQDYDAVVNWLKGEGFTITQTDASRLSVTARGTLAQIQAGLQLHMSTVTSEGKLWHAADTPPNLPQSISSPVLGVNHLQPFRHLVKHQSGFNPQTANSPPYLVSEILKAYNGLGMGVTGANQKIAILIDTAANNSDLTSFWTANGIAQSTANVEVVNVNNATLASPSGEETLDEEWSSGVAPGAKIRVYAAGSLAFSALDNALSRMINDLPTQPQMHQLSISLGLGETYLNQAQFNTDSQYFATLAASGVSIFVSSGDYGSTPNSSSGNTGPLQVEYFSSDPSVTGVGGTSIYVNSSTGLRTGETAWSGSGGGVSSQFNRPAWQTGNGVPAGTKRCVPDVSLTADPSTGAYVYLNGGVYQYGGTSWSAPMWAGFCALVNEARANLGKSPIGLMNPSLYPLNGTTNFYDITSGNNSTPSSGGLYTATAGYDCVTGLGSPNMAVLLNSLSAANPSISSFTPASGAINTQVVITGYNFGSASAVTFNGTAATFTLDSATQITTRVPSGATTGPISITTPNGTGSSSSNFTVTAGTPVPSITSFSPAYGSVGSSVTITGTYLTGATSVAFNGTPASYTVNSSTQITATVPSGATAGTITVTTGGGTATSPSSYYVLTGNGKPTVTAFSPLYGRSGDTVTLTGANYISVTGVSFNGTAATYTVNSASQITATIPSGATTGSITVTTSIGSGASSSAFTVYATNVGPIVISQLYGNGGGSSAIYANDFVELYNRSSIPFDLTGCSLQYANYNSSSWSILTLSGTVNPGQYYLIQLASGGSNGSALPAPDATGTINMSSTRGKVALVNGTNLLTTSNPSGLSNVLDLVGYGSNTNGYEGARAPSTGNTTGDMRKGYGSTDTGNNGSDFTATTPSARNSASAFNLPDMTVAVSHSGNFARSDVGDTYTITVTNSGTTPSNASVSLTDILPAGLTAAALAGTGWTCDLPTLTCTRYDPLAAGASYPPITLTVNVASNASFSITNSATVNGGGETNTSNNTGNDPTTVTLPAATVTLGSLAQTYDGTPKAATATTTPSGLAVSITYNGSSTVPVNAGSYSVLATVTDPNYQGSASGTLVISKASATVTLGSLAQTFNGSARTATATTSPTGLTVAFTYNGSSTAPTNPGSYAVVGTISDTNYQGNASGTLVVSKAAATVTLGSLAQTYNGSARTATATTAPTGLTVTFTYNGSSTAPTNAGSYAVIGTISDTNYQGNASGTLVVSKAAATVTLGSLAQTYNGSARPATATTSPTGLTVTFTYNGSSTAPTNAGSYAVVGTISDTNYQGNAAGSLVISKATATITLGSLAQTYDGSAKPATATTSPANLTVSLTYNGSPTAPTNAGSYAIAATISDANYQGSAADSLVISKAAATVTLGALAQTYDGSAKPATATTSPANLTVTITYNGSSTIPTNAGSYAVAGTISDANYQGNASGTLLISKAAATITLGSLAQTYDGSAKPATATTSPANLTVTITYNGSPTAPTNAGSYAVAATISDANYQGSAADSLVISKATATVTLGSLAQTFDGAPKSVSYSTTPSGLNLLITYDGSTTQPVSPGTYSVLAVIDDPNYQGSSAGSMQITGETLTAWRARVFSAQEISAGLADDTADPDGDGLTNLAEYALGANPHQFTPPLTATRSSAGLTLTFTRPKALPDVSYYAESSDDMILWTPLPIVLVTDGDTQTMSATDPLTSGNTARRFIRLRFTK